MWLRPVYDTLREQLRKESVLHADETTLQVLKESGRYQCNALRGTYSAAFPPARACCGKLNTKRTEKQNTRKNFWTGSLAGFMQIDTKDTTSCRNASEWWAAQLMPDVNLMRH